MSNNKASSSNRSSNNLKAKSKRYFTLLEVLIAFFLISMCALPLIYPHAFIYKQTKEFAEEVDLDRVAGLVYSTVLERLYANEFEWQQIAEGQFFPIDEDLIRRSGLLPESFKWRGNFWFEVIKEKTNAPKSGSNEKSNVTVNLIATHLDFKRSEMQKPFRYTYEAVIRRTFPNEGGVGEANEEAPTKETEPKK